MDEERLSQMRKEYRKLLQHSIDEIVTKLSHLDVVRVSLFGSYVSGRADLFTDLDVLVVMETVEPFPERLARLYSLLSVPVDMDILCYTPEEFERMKKTAFLQRILAEEVILYEKERR